VDNVTFAFLLTIGAGLATGIGAAIAFFSRSMSTRYLGALLGFSAGVMIYVSMMEILPKSIDTLTGELGTRSGSWLAIGSFFAGIAVIAIIDRLVPETANPHEFGLASELAEDSDTARLGSLPTSVPLEAPRRHQLMRTGTFMALAITIHNFPEGFATFMAALHDPRLAIPVAVAIALHNIPEGIAVSAPIYYATGNRRKAFGYAFASGLAEPAGAVIGYLVLAPFMSDVLFGVVFGMVAGIMIFISFDELLPTAEEYGQHHLAIYGLIAGMAVMAASLLLFI